MAANVSRAVDALRTLYDLPFGSKRRGRFVLTREQLGKMLKVKRVHETAIIDLQTDALEDENLVICELGDQLYGIIDAAVAARWRRVPKRNLLDALNEDEPTSFAPETREDDDDEP